MQYLGIEFSLKNQPRLDGSFIPFGVWERAYLKGAEKPFKIAVEREGGLVSVFETKLRGPAPGSGICLVHLRAPPFLLSHDRITKSAVP